MTVWSSRVVSFILVSDVPALMVLTRAGTYVFELRSPSLDVDGIFSRRGHIHVLFFRFRWSRTRT